MAPTPRRQESPRAELVAAALAIGSVVAAGCRTSDEGKGLAPIAAQEAGLGAFPLTPVPSPAHPAPPSLASSRPASEPWQQIGISMQAPPGSVEGKGCDLVLPLGWRADGGLGALSLTESGGRGNLRCAFVDPSDRGHQRIFQYSCDGAWVPPDELRARRDRFRQVADDARDVPSAGLIAWAGTVSGLGQAHMYDDKSPCEIVINFVGRGPPSDDFVRGVYERFRVALGK